MAEPEKDAGFPSGKWVGFYKYPGRPQRHRMDLHLAFSAGRVTGDGIDDIGRFIISGHYSCETRKCGWLKQYIGRHVVDYQGVQQGRTIGGSWKLSFSMGEFTIWPADHEAMTEEFFIEEKERELVGTSFSRESTRKDANQS